MSLLPFQRPPSIILWFLCIVPRPIQFPVSSAQLFLCFHSELRWETVMHGSAVDGTVALQQEGSGFESRLGPGLTCVSPAVRLPATQMWISKYRKWHDYCSCGDNCCSLKYLFFRFQISMSFSLTDLIKCIYEDSSMAIAFENDRTERIFFPRSLGCHKKNTKKWHYFVPGILVWEFVPLDLDTSTHQPVGLQRYGVIGQKFGGFTEFEENWKVGKEPLSLLGRMTDNLHDTLSKASKNAQMGNDSWKGEVGVRNWVACEINNF